MPASKPAGEAAAGRRIEAGLAIAALIGLALALVSTMADGTFAGPAPQEASIAALVNGRPIYTDAVERARGALETERGWTEGELPAVDILERLIEEELLLQDAARLDLVSADARLRSSVVRAMIDAVTLEAAAAEPDEAALRAFFEANSETFSAPATFAIRVLEIRKNGPRRTLGTPADRARMVEDGLERGVPFDEVIERVGDPPLVPVPDGMLHAKEVVALLGRTAAGAVFGLKPGETTGALSAGDGLVVVRLDRTAGENTPAFEAVRDVVAAEYADRAADDALTGYIDVLRDQAEVEIAERYRR